MKPKKQSGVHQAFAKTKIDREWSFHGTRSIDTYTHGYHRYPAKFLPELVRKLLEKYSNQNDVVADLFAGCGTTLVESKMHGRRSIGIDINPVATLITRAKITPIRPSTLETTVKRVLDRLDDYRYDKDLFVRRPERISYWFRKRERHRIYYLYRAVSSVRNKRIKIFLLCALSNILKNSSRWLQSSTKPQLDPEKKPADPFDAYKRQVTKMVAKNTLYYQELRKSKQLQTQCQIRLGDAKHSHILSESIDIIITSPPYVTSYEYADLHQLTGYWFGYMKELAPFRKNFIGSFHTNGQLLIVKDPLAQRIVNNLATKDNRTAREVARYFNDMNLVVKEAHRILREGKRFCLVVGNTKLLGVSIKLAEVLTNVLVSHDFVVEKIIRRHVPSKHKQIPTVRNKKTGRFSKVGRKNSVLVYPNEYVVVAKKAA